MYLIFLQTEMFSCGMHLLQDKLHGSVEILCGLLGEAQEIFLKLWFRDTWMWNTMILALGGFFDFRRWF